VDVTADARTRHGVDQPLGGVDPTGGKGQKAKAVCDVKMRDLILKSV
jgi:hypothetical protein